MSIPRPSRSATRTWTVMLSACAPCAVCGDLRPTLRTGRDEPCPTCLARAAPESPCR